MEKVRNNLSRAVENLSQTPLKNMMNNNSLYAQDSLNVSRMKYIKSFVFWFVIIILLSLYGLNIFKYLAQGTDIITALISPFTYVIALLTGDTVKSTIQNTSQGGQVLITEISKLFEALINFFTQLFSGSLKVAEKSSVSAIDQLQSNIVKDKINSTENNKLNQVTKNEVVKNNQELEDDINSNESTMLKNERKINERSREQVSEVKNSIEKKEKTEPVPLETGTLDHGYCYIGKSNNVRNCAKVSSKNKCMSGDIFPTMDLCINPNLRN
jgi:hypothetical protein